MNQWLDRIDDDAWNEGVQWVEGIALVLVILTLWAIGMLVEGRL